MCAAIRNAVQKIRPDVALATLAARQYGLITHAQAIAAGLTRSGIHRRLRSGRWRVFLPGVYVIDGAPGSWHQSVMGVCLWAGEGAVACGRAAAALHGIDGSLLPSSRSRRRARCGRRWQG